MICPACGSEYRDEYTRCAECDVDLVPEVTQERPAPLVKAFETSNAALVPVVRSLLDSAGIAFCVKKLSAFDTAGGLYGPIEFWVRESDVDACRQLLTEVPAAP